MKKKEHATKIQMLVALGLLLVGFFVLAHRPHPVENITVDDATPAIEKIRRETTVLHRSRPSRHRSDARRAPAAHLRGLRP